ncbi:hypothetical protein GGR52DRAFT_525600 [Hypoxylon sp. FL1284]|nr:hypothetical protein GGR52DRAFT_525600 [Hypoxylon sp. FL1284]
MATLYHNIVVLHFQHKPKLKANSEFNTVLERVSQIERWDYTCFGSVLGCGNKVIVVIGWKDDTGPQSQIKDLWSGLRMRLVAEPTILSLPIILHWSSLTIKAQLTEMRFLRGSPEHVKPDLWADNLELLCHRTVPGVGHVPPDSLGGCQVGTAQASGQDADITVVFYWTWVSPEGRKAFMDPTQESASQYVHLIGDHIRRATDAGAQLESVDVEFQRWRPDRRVRRHKPRCLVQ